MPTQIHPSDSITTPDLRILPLDMLVEHEFNDVQRTSPLAQRLQAEGLLKNPPIVAALEDGDPRYVVLDGANRTTALMHLGYPHVIAQVVPYEPPQVTLTTWHHVVAQYDAEEFIDSLAAVEGVELLPTNLLRARAGLARREYLMYAVRCDGLVFAARTRLPRREVHEQNRLLCALVDTYRERCRLHRAMTDHLQDMLALYPDLTGLVIFPQYDASEVLTLARDGELLPTGLTRHLIQGRVLRLNYPLSELRSDEPLEAKNERLQAWLRSKMASREVRFYGEMTFLFDE